MTRFFAALASLLILFSLPALALAEGFSEAELSRLQEGKVISREVVIDLPSGHFVGGVSYAIIDAPPSVVMKVVLDVGAFPEILPLALEAREIGRDESYRYIYFRHGSRFGTASYICQLRRESETLVRFWMDQSKEHDFEDAWGFFRVEPAGPGKSLLTYAGLIDLGFGFVHLFFEDKVIHYLLTTPELVQKYVRKHGLRGRGEAPVAPPSGPVSRGNVAP